MMYVRGSLQDYDDWAELAEDEGWSAETMQLYMRKHQVRKYRQILFKRNFLKPMLLPVSNINNGIDSRAD